MQYFVHFQASDSVVRAPRQPDQMKSGPFLEFIQLTYATLRSGPDGDVLATYDRESDVWVTEDGGVWSDVVITAEEEQP